MSMLAVDDLTVELGGPWSTSQVTSLTGTTWRQLDYWARNGWVNEAVGSGNPMVWTFAQLLRAQVLGMLTYRDDVSAKAAASGRRYGPKLVLLDHADAEFLLIEPEFAAIDAAALRAIVSARRGVVRALPLAETRQRLVFRCRRANERST